ncbi:MAG: ABC transporter permease [Muribaculaceae bacterium]|nr:ABC transporter permease [Muribaculaceae bacterium]
MPSILGLDVTWFNRDVDRTQCLLLSEKLYDKYKEFGILEKNTLTISKMTENNSDCVLPIAGTYKKTPYDQRNESLIAIAQDIDLSNAGYLLIPKEGRGKALERSAEETVRTLEPAAINKMVFNYRMMEGALPEMVEAVRAGGWILGIVSLIICVMSIFSTISLDTRSRRKEVAIRKVNGAKGKNIYFMFGKLYLILIAMSSIFVVPVSMLFNRWIMLIVKDMSHDSALSLSVMPIILGIAVVILLIIIIIVYQIHKVVIVDPSKIIAKE